MKHLLSIALVLSITSWSQAQQARRVPQEILDRIVDDEPNPLPRYMTPTERLLPSGSTRRPARSTLQPSTTRTKACSFAGDRTTRSSPR